MFLFFFCQTASAQVGLAIPLRNFLNSWIQTSVLIVVPVYTFDGGSPISKADYESGLYITPYHWDPNKWQTVAAWGTEVQNVNANRNCTVAFTWRTHHCKCGAHLGTIPE